MTHTVYKIFENTVKLTCDYTDSDESYIHTDIDGLCSFYHPTENFDNKALAREWYEAEVDIVQRDNNKNVSLALTAFEYDDEENCISATILASYTNYCDVIFVDDLKIPSDKFEKWLEESGEDYDLDIVDEEERAYMDDILKQAHDMLFPENKEVESCAA